MIRVYMLRHGQSVYQCLKIVAGMNEHGLSGLGKVQSKRVGEHLSKIKFDSVYCSDLKRCKDTYYYLSLALENRPYRVVFTQLLREKNPGLDFLKAYQNVSYKDYQPVGGETQADVANRVDTFFTQMIQHAQYQSSYQMLPMEGLNKLLMGSSLTQEAHHSYSLMQPYIQAQRFCTSNKQKTITEVLVISHAGFITEAIKYLKERQGVKVDEVGDGYLYPKNGSIFTVKIQTENNPWNCAIGALNFSKAINLPFENIAIQ